MASNLNLHGVNITMDGQIKLTGIVPAKPANAGQVMEYVDTIIAGARAEIAAHRNAGTRCAIRITEFANASGEITQLDSRVVTDIPESVSWKDTHILVMIFKPSGVGSVAYHAI